MVVLTGSVPFVARERELAVLDDVTAGTADGRGGAALVRAPAGAGKSRLLDEAVARSSPADATVLRATAAQLQRDVPFAVADDLLRRQQPAAPPTTAGAYATALERLALTSPLVLVVDDLQWCDDASMLVLEKLAASTADLPLALLLSTRPAPTPSSLSRLERAIERAPVAAVVELPALDDDDLRALAAATFDGDPPPIVTELLTATGGNALHATTVLRHVATTGAAAIDDARAGIDAAVRRFLLELPDATIDLLRWAAVLGVRFDLGDLALVTDRATDDLLAVLRPARDLGVVIDDDGLRFAHDLVRDALQDEEVGEVRAARHTQVLAALATVGAGPDRWAGHLEHADLPALPGAVGLLRQAAASRLPVPARRRAAWLERALDLAGDLDLDLALDLLEARRHARDLGGHTALLETLLDRVDAMTPAQRTRLGLSAAFGPEDRQGTLDLLHRLVDAGADEGAGLLVELLEAERRGAAPRDEVARRVLAAAVTAQHPQLQARAAFVLTLEETDEARLDELVDVMLDAARRQVPHEARFGVALALAAAGGTFSRAAPLVDESLDLAVQMGSQAASRLRGAQFWLHAYVDSAWATAFAGEEWRGVIMELTAAPSRDWNTFTVPYTTVGILLELDRADDARWAVEHLERHAAQSAGVLRGDMTTRVDVLVHQARALLLLAGGHREAARPHIEAIVHSGDWDVAVLADRAGATDLAARCADAASERAAGTPNARNRRHERWARAAATRSAIGLDGELSPAWGDVRERWVEHLHLDEVLGDLHTGDGNTDAAVHHHTLALQWFEARAARVGAARVRAKLRALGVQPASATRPSRATSGWDAITPAEWRTLDLIERDLLYREIAEELFLSRRTVESHVQSARRKLDAPDRRTLTGLLREGDGATRLAAWRATPS